MTEKTRLDIIESYEQEIKDLTDEVRYVATRYHEKREIKYNTMITLQWLLNNEIRRLETVVKLFKGELK